MKVWQCSSTFLATHPDTSRGWLAAGRRPFIQAPSPGSPPVFSCANYNYEKRTSPQDLICAIHSTCDRLPFLRLFPLALHDHMLSRRSSNSSSVSSDPSGIEETHSLSLPQPAFVHNAPPAVEPIALTAKHPQRVRAQMLPVPSDTTSRTRRPGAVPVLQAASEEVRHNRKQLSQ